MLGGFRLIGDVGLPPGEGGWGIAGLAYGELTDFDLHISLSEKPDRHWLLVFPRPESFRILNESDLDLYWRVRDMENAGYGLLYSIAHSPYLAEMARCISGQTRSLFHYLVATGDDCIEVVTSAPPILPIVAASPAR